MLKTLAAATLLALSSIAAAQTPGAGPSDSSTTATTSGSGVGGVDLTNKCMGMMGAERDKCLLEQRSGASVGATTSGTASSPAIGTTTPAPLTTPGSPTNPTILPGSATTPRQN